METWRIALLVAVGIFVLLLLARMHPQLNREEPGDRERRRAGREARRLAREERRMLRRMREMPFESKLRIHDELAALIAEDDQRGQSTVGSPRPPASASPSISNATVTWTKKPE